MQWKFVDYMLGERSGNRWKDGCGNACQHLPFPCCLVGISSLLTCSRRQETLSREIIVAFLLTLVAEALSSFSAGKGD